MEVGGAAIITDHERVLTRGSWVVASTYFVSMADGAIAGERVALVVGVTSFVAVTVFVADAIFADVLELGAGFDFSSITSPRLFPAGVSAGGSHRKVPDLPLNTGSFPNCGRADRVGRAFEDFCVVDTLRCMVDGKAMKDVAVGSELYRKRRTIKRTDQVHRILMTTSGKQRRKTTASQGQRRSIYFYRHCGYNSFTLLSQSQSQPGKTNARLSPGCAWTESQVKEKLQRSEVGGQVEVQG